MRLPKGEKSHGGVTHMKKQNRDPTALYYATDVSERELILLDPLDTTLTCPR